MSASDDVITVQGKEYIKTKKLAEGGFAQLYLISRNGKQFVAKLQTIQRELMRDVVQKEVKLLKRFGQHPNIVSLIAAERVSTRQVCIVLEYCQGGQLFDVIQRYKEASSTALPEKTAWTVFRDVCNAVKHLHSCSPKIAHWDIKLENILKQGNTFKLCDFGSCVEGPQPCTTKAQRNSLQERVAKCTSESYRAPEMVDMFLVKQIDEKPDCWALGCVLFSLSYFKHPFMNAGSLAILNGRYEIPSSIKRSQAMRDCFTRCFVINAIHRAEAAELFERAQAALEGRAAKLSEGVKAAIRASTASAQKSAAKKTRKKIPQKATGRSLREQKLRARRAAIESRLKERGVAIPKAQPHVASAASAPQPAAAAEQWEDFAWPDEGASSASSAEVLKSKATPTPSSPTWVTDFDAFDDDKSAPALDTELTGELTGDATAPESAGASAGWSVDEESWATFDSSPKPTAKPTAKQTAKPTANAANASTTLDAVNDLFDAMETPSSASATTSAATSTEDIFAQMEGSVVANMQVQQRPTLMQQQRRASAISMMGGAPTQQQMMMGRPYAVQYAAGSNPMMMTHPGAAKKWNF